MKRTERQKRISEGLRLAWARKKNDRQYQSELRALVQIILMVAEDLYDSIDDLAKKSGLSKQTIYNLRSGVVTLPQHYTLMALARVTGISYQIKKQKITLKVA